MASTPRRIAAVLMVVAVVLANVAFIGLGSVFTTRTFSRSPPTRSCGVSRRRRRRSSALHHARPVGGSARSDRAPARPLRCEQPGRWSIGVGIAAAAVQVIGLLRWPLIVPCLADSNDTDAFDTVHTVLGTVVGETFGYLLTATWTVLIILALGRRLAGRWFSFLGYGAAALIAVGVLVPLDVPGTDFANFVGYILWSIWMLAFATLIWRGRSPVGGPASADVAT